MMLAHKPCRSKARPRWPSEPVETPLFGRGKPLPRARLAVAGFLAGETCLFHDPKQPGRREKATVVAALPRFHEIVIQVQGRLGHITLNPILHPDLVSRPPAVAGSTP